MAMLIRRSTWIALFQRVGVEREAPRLFAQALSRELDSPSPSPVAALRTLIGDGKAAEPIDRLFQAQCDQLRQFCEQTKGEG